MFHVNTYIISSLSAFIGSVLLSLLVALKGEPSPQKKAFLPIALLAGSWCLFPAASAISEDRNFTLMMVRLVYISGLYTGPAFMQFGLTIARREKFEIERKLIRISYIIATLWLPFLFSPFFITGVLKYQPYFSLSVGNLYPLFILFFSGTCGYSFYRLFREFLSSYGYVKNQIKYIFIAYFIAFLSALIHFGSAYGLKETVPHDTLVFVCMTILAYAIIKYHLMDIRLAITRAGIFIFVYTGVLGLPFFIGSKLTNNWIIPTGVAVVLATAGPFLYLFLQRKAEERLLQEERRINTLLTQASYGMTSIHSLPQLLNLIVDVLEKILKVEKAKVFILNQAVNQYELRSPGDAKGTPAISGEDGLIQALMKQKSPLVYEEVKSRSDGHPNGVDAQSLLSQMKAISGQVVVPIAIDSALLGFIVLSERSGRETYSSDLLSALGVLGNQAALAVKNCYFLEEEAVRMERAGLEERRVSLDHVTSSMAHEIDNPMAVINSHTEYLQILLENPLIQSLPEALKADINKSLNYILEARSRVSGMISAIKEYSKKTSGELKPVQLAEVEDGYWKLFGHEFKNEVNKQVHYTKEIAENLPYILGDKIQLEEVLFNLANNALHAVRRSAVKEIKLKIFQKDEDWVRLEYSDTGYGIEKNIIGDIFLAHVTTKGSTEGSGLGLFRMRKIVELHKGRVWAESAGKDKGARMIIELPVFKGDVKACLDKEKEEAVSKRMF